MRWFRTFVVVLIFTHWPCPWPNAAAQDASNTSTSNSRDIPASDRPPQPVYKIGKGVSAPRVVATTDPEYSKEAKKAKYQGVCVLWMVVEADGKPSNIRVIRSLGMGLDDKAIEAVRNWRFQPAMKDGKPVRVAVNVEVNFHLYDEGGVDPKLAARANAGDPKAELDLGMLYLEGRKVPRNEGSGKSLLQRAADQGLAKAQFQLAERIYRYPTENFIDYVTAYTWYTLARRGGEKKADKPLKELTSKMTPEQLAEAQARVDNWKPTSAK